MVAWSTSVVLAQNAIVLENQLPGTNDWDISGAGDTNIQGFGTDISVNQGDTVHFKISSPSNFGIRIYRLGYYQGNGARLIADLGTYFTGVVQTVPAPDPDTGLVDCGGWTESASWAVPANAVTGIYIAKLTRNDTGGASHIAFIVRNDASHSDLFFQASDTTWQAYNFFAGESLYAGTTSYPNGHATKVSYNRPFITRNGGGGGGEGSDAGEDWLFNAEYPMIRWLEANGYDVTYTTDTDSDRRGNLILNHKVFLSVGHDEYWSAAQRANVQAARDAGVNLAFFSGNEIYWKTRWEADGSGTSNRTLVCYKEGTLGENVCGGLCDPLTSVWTGLWRDGCPPTYPTNDGCAPENELSGQISWDGTTGTILVPDTYKSLRFWRNTAVASLGTGQTQTLAANTLGYEWDWDQYDSYYPPGRILLSSTVLDGRTHNLSLYRAASGALVFGAGTVQWSWGLDGNHDRGGSTPDVNMQQATVNLLADMSVQPGSLQAGLVAATASSDTQPPGSIISSPANDSTIPSGNTVTISGTAVDAGGGVVAGVDVSVDDGATWNAATGTTNWTYDWTPTAQGAVTIESRAFDDSGNLEIPGGGESGNLVTVTVTAGGSSRNTIFQPTDAPVNASDTDNLPLELGVKFQASVNGYVTGVRFYKGILNTGAHIGDLWSNDTTKLAEATFTGETASGWQEVSFDSPVAIASNTTYIAAYHSTGYYADTTQYFTSAVTNGQLTALADGQDGPNGVYIYSSTPAFPSSSASSPYNMANYWVDVVFSTNLSQDVTPPTVELTSPAAGATGVLIGSSVTATFSEAIDSNTINGTTFELRDSSNTLVPATVTYNDGLRTATLTPSASLAYDTIYTVTLLGGATGIKDLAGNALANDDVWAFTTAGPPLPPPTEGPGGPILVISAAENPFSRYYVEILRAEGLNEFTAMDISLVTSTVLNNYDVVILGDMPLTAPQVSMLTDWVNAGGNLIASHPDKQLAGLLGLTDASATISNAYLRIYGTGAGAGIVTNSIQFHGVADLYTLNGATTLASLYSNATNDTSQPAVTLRSVGSNGGHAAAFTFDLARSVVYTRQGNPAWAGQDRDGISPIRSDDMFYGAAAGDPEPDWIDLNKVAIPQADEQQRLLANLILQMNFDRKPLPRFWYFPRGLKAVVLMTGDDHANGGTVGRFQTYEADSPTNGSVDNWECIRSSSYIYPGTPITDQQATQFVAAGFEIGTHVYTGCADWTPDQLTSDFSNQLAEVAAQLPDITPALSERTHCIAWSDWATQPKLELTNGIRLDLNYYYWPPTWVQDRPGFFTGSGMPMRFADLDGTIIDCYQACTQMTDESGQSYPFTIDSLIVGALGPQGYYGVFAANMHTDYAASAGSDAIVASAQANGVPVVSGRQMLTWLDGRNTSSFGSMSWSNNTLSFTVTAGTGANGLQAMVPTASAAGPLSSITSGANSVAYTNQTIKGVEYAFFSVTNATYQAAYTPDTTPPVISGVTATAQLGGVATITWTTDESSDSEVIYGTDSNSLTLSNYDSTLVTSHSITLTGLSISTTYYYRVVSTDVYGNNATSPASPASPASFNTPSAGFVDTTVADFSAGTTNNTYISDTYDGEVILNPTVGTEFYGSTLPAGWTTGSFGTGSSVTVAGGSLAVDGAIVQTTASYGPGRSLEFVATFGATTFQHVGFASDLNSNPPWAIFSTFNTTTTLYARTALAGESSPIDIPIPGNWLGSSHRYRIDWTTSNVVFSIDGTPVATNSAVISSAMFPEVSDYNVGNPNLSVDWMRMSPYPASGTFVSRVFDAGSAANWTALSWDSQMPAGTSLAMSYRIGNTPTPDASWTAFIPVSNSGSTLTGNARYFQYSAQLATSDPNQTPELDDVTVNYNLNPDTTPPTIILASPAPSVTGVSTNTTVTVSFNEPMNTATITTSTFRLRRVGDSFDLATTLTSPGATATLTPNSPLLPGQTYQVTVAGTVTDANGNPLGSDTVWTFSTTAATASQTDTTVADFSAGSTAGCSLVVSEIGDGEVILAPALDEEFPGTTLSANWTSGIWNDGGSVTVGGDALTVNGAHAATTASFGLGSSMEFVATFQAVPYQNVGFSSDFAFNSPWVTFGSSAAGNGVYARASDGTDVLISSALLGTPHDYKIVWNPSSFVFYVDGAQVATINITVAGNMVAHISDVPVSADALQVNWMRLSPYTTPCIFTSRVIDATNAVTWSTLVWDALTPTGTTLAMSYRTGNTPTPDGTWTAFTPVSTSGGALAGSSRYFQYEAALATSDTTQTPVLEDVTVTYVLYVPPGPSSTALTSSANPALPGTAVTFTATVTGAGTPTGTVQFKTNGVAFGSAVTLSSGSASSAPVSTLPHGDNAITAEYSGDANFLASTGSLTQTIDTPPKSATHFFGTPMNTPLSITASTLAGLDYDADGDALTVANVSSASTNGPAGNVTFTGGTTITYTPKTDYAGPDLFTYVVSDGYPGGTATNSIVVTVRLASGVTSVFNFVSTPSGGSVTLRGYGVPGNSYEIQKSDDMMTWTTIGTANALPNGLILFTDPNATNSQAYYRIATP